MLQRILGSWVLSIIAAIIGMTILGGMFFFSWMFGISSLMLLSMAAIFYIIMKVWGEVRAGR